MKVLNKFLSLIKIQSFSLFLLIILTTSNTLGQNVKTYIHPKSVTLLPLIKKEVSTFAPMIEEPWYFPGLFEHESCIHLKHSRCWDTRAELKNEREHGLGLSQLTASWDKNGRLRFDNLTTLKKRYPKELGELSWDTFKNRPDLQIRAGVIMISEEYGAFSSIKVSRERLKMADSSYNGGRRDVIKGRELCKLTRGCDPQIWDLNVERHLPKNKIPDARYGGQSMYSINVKHVNDVFDNRMPKFKQFWDE